MVYHNTAYIIRYFVSVGNREDKKIVKISNLLRSLWAGRRFFMSARLLFKVLALEKMKLYFWNAGTFAGIFE